MPWTELCPAIGDLTAVPLDGAVLEHARRCPRCTTLARELAGTTGAPRASRPPSAPVRSARWACPPEALPGELYALSSPERDELELALVTGFQDRDVAVLAVSEDHLVGLCGAVALERSTLGFNAAVVTELGGLVLPEQLDARIGAMDAAQLQALETSRQQREPASDSEQLRLRELREAWEPYVQPAWSLRETSTLGELVTLRQGALGASSAQLADACQISESEIDALRGDRPDALSSVSPQKLAAVLRSLYVSYSQKLAERITLALMLCAGAEPQGLLARRQTRDAGRRDPQQIVLERYLEQVRDALP
jgi:hypothetical protein